MAHFSSDGNQRIGDTDTYICAFKLYLTTTVDIEQFKRFVAFLNRKNINTNIYEYKLPEYIAFTVSGVRFNYRGDLVNEYYNFIFAEEVIQTYPIISITQNDVMQIASELAPYVNPQEVYVRDTTMKLIQQRLINILHHHMTQELPTIVEDVYKEIDNHHNFFKEI